MTTSDVEHAQVLITGGTSGIGLGLAQRYWSAGARVLVTGRDAARLVAAATRYPGLLTYVSDMGDAPSRESLTRRVRDVLPDLSILLNNAGIQRRVSLATDQAPWNERQAEIDILLAGPVHLTSLLVPAMLDRGHEATVVNVTSGGAYIPQPFAPVYSACKAALHSYTVTLRHALRDTNILVKELIPPAVATGLVSADTGRGASLDAFCDGVFPALIDRTTTQIGFGMTATEAFQATQHLYQDMFERFSSRFPVVIYAERLGRA